MAAKRTTSKRFDRALEIAKGEAQKKARRTKATKAKRVSDAELDEQIQRWKLLDDPDDEVRGLAHAAVMVPVQHGALARRVRRDARVKIAEIIELRRAEKADRYSRPIKIF